MLRFYSPAITVQDVISSVDRDCLTVALNGCGKVLGREVLVTLPVRRGEKQSGNVLVATFSHYCTRG